MTSRLLSRGTVPTAVLALVLLANLSVLPGQSPALVDEQVITGIPRPMDLCWLPDGRMIVGLRDGTILVRPEGSSPQTVGSVSGPVTFSEMGLFSVVVDPAWPARPYLYISYSNGNPNRAPATSRVSMLEIAGDLSNPASGNLSLVTEHLLIDFPNLHVWHQGGGLAFGPDGYLYAAFGDDVVNECDALDPAKPQGKVLRLDVSGFPVAGAMPPPLAQLAAPGNPFSGPVASTVWATGFRNPYTISIDPVTGKVAVGDVGTYAFEEINVLDGPAQNGGWPFLEGNAPAPTAAGLSCPPVSSPTTPLAPVFAYGDNGPNSVIVLGIYRNTGGPLDLGPEYEGDIFFVDHFDPQVRRLDWDGTSYTEVPFPVSSAGLRVTGGEIGPDGALYYTWPPFGFGHVHRVRPLRPAEATSFGDAGLSASGEPFTLSASSSPLVGNLGFSLDVEEGLPLAPNWFFFALDASPTATATFGAHATTHLDLNTALLFVQQGTSPIQLDLDASGEASLPLPLGPGDGAVGFGLAFQALTIEGGSLVMSNTLKLVLGLD